MGSRLFLAMTIDRHFLREERTRLVVLLTVLVTVYLVIIIVSGVGINRKYRGVFIAESERISTYWQAIAESWGATLILGAIALLAGFGLDTSLGLGLHFFQFRAPFALTIPVLIIAGGFAILTIAQLFSLATNFDARMRAWQQISDGARGNAVLADVGANLLIPRSAREKDLFTLVSLSAGVCEEFTLRGVLFVVFAVQLPDLPVVLIPLIAGVLFGVAHCYQGIQGVLKTGLMGIGFGYLYLVCGSLIPGMILHFIVDFTNRFIFPNEFPALIPRQIDR
jgi:hypothetical protein